ncbi:response regulator (plasmid) [Azospirillum sp. B510]|uniref:response regulator transcription factor n=1 Tax=Azospirillum sp. (strain B510) TaxID=137722 RepID=UPI0001C4CE19|nr:response regulator transcription factor [Azospirillum sp. B510]BAI76240.1 response regulator [Azospirillum sp. B510]
MSGQPLSPAPQLQVILLEDDEDQRDALVMTLCGLGLAVEGVGSMADFYRRLLVQRYDVAIVDLGLPDGDGRSVVHFIAEHTSMGIIILSAAGDIEERIRGFHTGADLYFVKPVDCRELAAAAVRLFNRSSGGRLPRPAAGADRKTGGGGGMRAECWLLVPSRWLLVAPDGGEMMLTPKEMRFIEVLARQPGEVVPRNVFIRHLGYPDDTGGHRRLEALIRRLRMKAEEVLGRSLPVSTVHGVGYSFSRSLTVAVLPSS